MSERITRAKIPGLAGIAQSGRKTRAEMIAMYRSYYQRQLKQATQALAATDDEIVVETYTGVWAENNIKVVTE